MIRMTLDKALKERGMSRYRLSQLTGVQFQVIDKYYKNKIVRYDSYLLDRFCQALNCKIGDIIEYTTE
ncbi:MAG: helix-turn-helix transcriptional regulator [Ruminococcaceae bacterium]|nr:helix-turn-helix transcriptional regulator [Oscillospiraceae bacterium]MBR2914264.1 helix-turn-helix transcriptional regulator [Clostridia bacterium]